MSSSSASSSRASSRSSLSSARLSAAASARSLRRGGRPVVPGRPSEYVDTAKLALGRTARGILMVPDPDNKVPIDRQGWVDTRTVGTSTAPATRVLAYLRGDLPLLGTPRSVGTSPRLTAPAVRVPNEFAAAARGSADGGSRGMTFGVGRPPRFSIDFTRSELPQEDYLGQSMAGRRRQRRRRQSGRSTEGRSGRENPEEEDEDKGEGEDDQKGAGEGGQAQDAYPHAKDGWVPTKRHEAMLARMRQRRDTASSCGLGCHRHQHCPPDLSAAKKAFDPHMYQHTCPVTIYASRRARTGF